MLDKIFKILQSPVKALGAVITGTITGYVPEVVSNTAHISMSSFDTMFQHAVWTITILVGITAIISWVQKQFDRRKKNRNNEPTNAS